MKQNRTRFLSLVGVLIIGSGLLAGCGSAENRAVVNSSNSQNAAGASANGAGKTPEVKTSPTAAPDAALVKIYDGRDGVSDAAQKTGTAAEKQLVEKEFKTNEAAILQKSKFKCDEGTDEGVSILGSADGAFTKSDAKQKAYLYERCRAGRSFGIGGVMVVEDGKAVAHYLYGENGLAAGMFALPDIDKNGLSEIALIFADTNQGYGTTSVDIIEATGQSTVFLGRTQAHTDNSGAAMDDAKVETTDYVISVQPSTTPTFLRDTYKQTGEKGKAESVKKAEKFTLDKKEPSIFIKIT